jgi:hypothetical protein
MPHRSRLSPIFPLQYGETPLHSAAGEGYLTVVQFLVNRDANLVNAVDNVSISPDFVFRFFDT